jgi:hypothetical protein
MKTIQWESSFSMRVEAQTDIMKLIVAFRNFAKAPKNPPLSKLHNDTLFYGTLMLITLCKIALGCRRWAKNLIRNKITLHTNMQTEKLFTPGKHNNFICAANQVNRNQNRASTLGKPSFTYT